MPAADNREGANVSWISPLRGAISTTLSRASQAGIFWRWCSWFGARLIGTGTQHRGHGVGTEGTETRRCFGGKAPPSQTEDGASANSTAKTFYLFFVVLAWSAATQASMALRVALAHWGKARDSTYSTASEPLPPTESWYS